MVRWPGRVTPKRDETTLVSSLDLAPTILRACNLNPTDRMPGINLLDDQSLQQREAIFGEIFSHDIVSIDDPVQSLKYRWCARNQWKLILPHSKNVPDEPAQLYNLNSDPHENQNLGDEHPETVQQLKRRIEDWWSNH
jgi:uncharacterized sulfatase